ncbi:hypothetical protein GCM10020331_052400 [Ectobacillus funiculus]
MPIRLSNLWNWLQMYTVQVFLEGYFFDPNTMNPFMGDGQEKLQALKDMMNERHPSAKTPNRNSNDRPYASQPLYTNENQTFSTR